MTSRLKLGAVGIIALATILAPQLIVALPDDRAVPLSPVARQIARLVKQPRLTESFGFKLLEPALTKRFYEQSPEPVWSRHGAIFSQRVRKLLKAADQLISDGFDPRRYQIPTVRSFVLEGQKNPDDAFLAAADVLLTDTFLRYANALLYGQADPKKLYADWFLKPDKGDPVAVLASALDENLIDRMLLDLVPRDAGYVQLRSALKRYRELKAKGGWPQLPRLGKKWEPGAQGPHIEVLRKRLQASGELEAGDVANPEFFDAKLKKALMRFQRQNGLNEDGIVGPNTWRALNRTVDERIRQIKVNMERYRWMPRDFAERYVFVNIPEYQVRFIEKGRTKFTMRSIVGKRNWRTPVFSDELEFIVINPRWNVPPKIAKEEMIPKARKDPSYFARAHFNIYKKENGRRVKVDPMEVDWSQAEASDFFFSQRAGGGNSLGRLKFMFPNQHSIYLHDTPSKYLFERDRRAYSHGCVRIEKPLDFAELVLEGSDPKWDQARIKQAIQSGQRQKVRLPKTIPILIYYLTAWVEADGSLQFRDDVYGYDEKLARALNF